jgi:hypothetical protein
VVKGGISYGSDGYRRPGAAGLDLAGLGWRNAQARPARLRRDVRGSQIVKYRGSLCYLLQLELTDPEFGLPEGTGDSDEQARQPVRKRKRPGFMLYERGKGR